MLTNSRQAMPLSLSKTDALWQRAIESIPTGAQTFSKAPFQHVEGVSPKMLARGKGSHVWDADGNQYVDYMLGLGPVILGHADSEINAAITESMDLGTAMSLPHPLETDLAEKLCQIIPCAEMVRYGKNGSDVTAGAVRAARALTGREHIACCGYHGWQDWFIGTTWRNHGVPQAVRDLTLKFNYNDIESLEKLFDAHPGQIAGVIMEPVNFYEPHDNFLSKVKDLTHRNGALLVFDEIITGFRMAMGGAQQVYDVTPDLACFGKALGNGLPISAIVGQRKYMEVFDDIFFSFTFGGELASIAAGLATIKALEEREALSKIHASGRRLKEGFHQIITLHDANNLVNMIGFDFWPEYVFQAADNYDPYQLQSLFQQELVRRGVLTRAGMFISASHTDEDIDKTLSAMDAALGVVKTAVETGALDQILEGKVITPVIRPPVSEPVPS